MSKALFQARDTWPKDKTQAQFGIRPSAAGGMWLIVDSVGLIEQLLEAAEPDEQWELKYLKDMSEDEVFKTYAEHGGW